MTFAYGGLEMNLENVISGHPKFAGYWAESVIHPRYTRQFGRFEISVGWRLKRFPSGRGQAASATNEGYAQISFLGILNPTYTIVRDVQLGSGWYQHLQLLHPVRLSRRVTLEGMAGIGLNQHYFIKQTTVSDVSYGLAARISVTSSFGFAPFYNYIFGHRSIFGRRHVIGVSVVLGSE